MMLLLSTTARIATAGRPSNSDSSSHMSSRTWAKSSGLSASESSETETRENCGFVRTPTSTVLLTVLLLLGTRYIARLSLWMTLRSTHVVQTIQQARRQYLPISNMWGQACIHPALHDLMPPDQQRI